MFSGIVEQRGEIVALKKENGNLHITVKTSFDGQTMLSTVLKIDQSIAHNGACLTVINIQNDTYTVTAIDETLKKTNLALLQTGDIVNLERCMKLGDRLDGHIVQGHVDQTAVCIKREDGDGSVTFTFSYDETNDNITVEKGSVCVNGVSLTVVDSTKNSFSVCIIPYTLEHTNLKNIKEDSVVNLEFDIIGKYISRLLKK